MSPGSPEGRREFIELENIVTNAEDNCNVRKRKNRSEFSTPPKLPNNRPRTKNTFMENMLEKVAPTVQNKKT